jgi:hypothetical protein
MMQRSRLPPLSCIYSHNRVGSPPQSRWLGRDRCPPAGGVSRSTAACQVHEANASRRGRRLESRRRMTCRSRQDDAPLRHHDAVMRHYAPLVRHLCRIRAKISRKSVTCAHGTRTAQRGVDRRAVVPRRFLRSSRPRPPRAELRPPVPACRAGRPGTDSHGHMDLPNKACTPAWLTEVCRCLPVPGLPEHFGLPALAKSPWAFRTRAFVALDSRRAKCLAAWPVRQTPLIAGRHGKIPSEPKGRTKPGKTLPAPRRPTLVPCKPARTCRSHGNAEQPIEPELRRKRAKSHPCRLPESARPFALARSPCIGRNGRLSERDAEALSRVASVPTCERSSEIGPDIVAGL